MAEQKRRKFHLLSYLSPGIPLGLYQIYQHFLEELLQCESYLSVESRYPGPPAGKPDPFTEDEVDIAFMSGYVYQRLASDPKCHVELMLAAPVHIHEKSELRPVYFADVIIPAESKGMDTYKIMEDLKGHAWAYNNVDSLSGNIVVQAELKSMGHNASFFGNVVQSGSHLKSIEMVLEETVDAAAIDSSVLANYLVEHPEDKEQIRVLCSLGPLPIQPVVLNSRLPADVKLKITEGFLSINKHPVFGPKLAKFQVWGFKPIDGMIYEAERDMRGSLKSTQVTAVYY